MKWGRIVIAAFSALPVIPAAASAHAMGEAFSLALPFSYLAAGASAALLYSFIAFLVFSEKHTGSDHQRPRIRASVSESFIMAVSALGLTTLVVTLFHAWFGSEQGHNIAPTMFWIVLMLGVLYASVVVDGLWRWLNPFETLTRLIVRGSKRIVSYPLWLGVYPACLFYAALFAVELFYAGSSVPETIGILLSVYILISIIGAAIFGNDAWFENGDFFNVYFSLAGKMATLALGRNGSVVSVRPAARLSNEYPSHVSTLALALLMLSSTSVDGITDTVLWSRFVASYPHLIEHELAAGMGLLVIMGVALGFLYALAVLLMKHITKTETRLSVLLLRFTYPLVPIALAYSAAHYFMLFIPGVALPVEGVWALQIVLIVAGHVFGTYIAHRIALEEGGRSVRGATGQIPMLILMMFYTCLALYILSLGI